MIVDSSALVAILRREPGFEELLRKIAQARSVAAGAPTVAETQLVLSLRTGSDASFVLNEFLAEFQIAVVPFGREHLSSFTAAIMRYGKGRHPARLNMGDCFSYAIAQVSGLPLLFVGNDFSQTDILAA